MLEDKRDARDDENKFVITVEQSDGTKFDVEIEADKMLEIFKILFSDMKS